MEAEEIDVAAAHSMWRLGDVFVDVRSAEEYAAGHIPGALNIPLDKLAFRLEELPEHSQVVTVCSMGNRSMRGAEKLARLERAALSLRGGTKAWAAAGHPVETGGVSGERTASSGSGLRGLLRRLRR
ncbi:rhodanese-like domain-containing protein [Flindersiella endophytica]